MKQKRLYEKTCYHYTDIVGFRGIIEEGMWLSCAAYTNDSSEISEGKGIFIETLREIGRSVDVRYHLFFEELIAEIQAKIDPEHYFVGSFSKHGDSLSQWRSYARDGGGICMAFEFDTVTPAYELLYPENAKSQEVKNFCLELWEECRSAIDGGIEPSALYDHMVEQATMVALLIKNRVFISEEEIRLISQTQSAEDVHFRTHGSYLKPYVIKDIKSHLRAVHIGPTVNEHRVQKSITYFLKHYGLERVDVHTFDVPYQG